MKNGNLLIALCVLFSLSAVAQSTTVVEKNTKRITITTKKTDDNGKAITETWIAEGNEPEKILKEMAINPEGIQKVEFENATKADHEERLFLFRSAGDKRVIEGKLNENADQDKTREVIIITTREGEADQKEYKKISTWHGKGEGPRAYSYFNVHNRKSNCAALGVWVTNDSDLTGARINGLIERGGAMEAGLKEGDMLRKIDEFEVEDFTSLHLALSHFQPGDRVTVRYERDGKLLKTKVNLKDWAQLPGHEWRSRSDCGKPEPPVENTDQTMLDEPSFLKDIQPLALEDARIYPNPTDGVFALSFTAEKSPLTVSIADVNGKVVFQEISENASGYYHRDIDLKDMPQGNYLISVTQEDKVFTQQISKQ